MGIIDLKEFFLSGSDEQLCRDVPKSLSSPSLSQDTLNAFEYALGFLLRSQYVKNYNTSSHQMVYHRCMVGTGMGLVQSSEVADAAFFVKVEQHWLFQPNTLYGVRHTLDTKTAKERFGEAL